MIFEITSDNKPYLDARGKIILNACPGSGKTTAVSYKLGSLQRECRTKFGQYAGIACLSFTNIAKQEILEKYRNLFDQNLTYPNLVSTIDSFINQYITLPYYYLLEHECKRPQILNSVSFLNDMNLGYFPIKNSKRDVKHSYPPSDLKYELDGTITNNGTPPNSTIIDAINFKKYAEKYKNWQLSKGYINNDDSAFIAYSILIKYPSIAKNLVQRFPFIIIDEAQDTSEIQYRIFDLLIDAGLENIEFVGDPYQSLYEFRKACPELFLQRVLDTINWTSLCLKDCRRSSQNIVDAYSLFRSKGEVEIKSTCKHSSDHKLKVIRFDENNITELVTKYSTLVDLTRQNYILVRGSTHLQKFGAKPNEENPWKNDLAKMLIQARFDFATGNIKPCIDGLRSCLTFIQLPNGDLKERIDLEKELKSNAEMNARLFAFVREMPTINNTLKGWTDEITIYIKNQFGIIIDLKLKQKGAAYQQQNVQNLFFPSKAIDFPISTIHKVKGMTFNSVMLVISAKGNGQSISLNDFLKPDGLPNEKQRMIYVALSRAEVLSCIAIPNNFTKRQIIDQLGTNIDFI